MKYRNDMGEVWEKSHFYCNHSTIDHTINKDGFICFTGQDGKKYETDFTKEGFDILLKSALGHL